MVRAGLYRGFGKKLGGEVLPFHNLRWLRAAAACTDDFGSVRGAPHSGKSGMSMLPRVGFYLGGLLCDCVDLATMHPSSTPEKPPAADLQAQPLDAPISSVVPVRIQGTLSFFARNMTFVNWAGC